MIAAILIINLIVAIHKDKTKKSTMTIQQALKNTAVNGVISIERAVQAVQGFDKERAATADLLKECEKNVGMYLGEKINEHLASMTGKHFSAVDYHYEIPNGEQ